MGKITKIALIGLLGMVGGITALQQLGSNLEQEFVAQAAAEPVADAAIAAPAAPPPSKAQPKTVARGDTILEQAIFDAFPATRPTSAADRKRSSNAKDFISAAINTQGYLCAEPVEMAKAQSQENIYGIKCVMNRDGTGVAGYIVDAGTGLVMPIS